METNHLYLIGVKDVASQTVLADGIITLGDVYRRYCRKNSCGTKVFDNTSTGITLGWDGMYHITATLVGTGTEAGDVTVQLFENGVPVTGAVSTQTITTPETEFRTFYIDYFVLVDQSCVLGCSSTLAKTISLENVGVGATFTSVVVNIEKEA
jgi:hypothetical protein